MEKNDNKMKGVHVRLNQEERLDVKKQAMEKGFDNMSSIVRWVWRKYRGTCGQNKIPTTQEILSLLIKQNDSGEHVTYEQMAKTICKHLKKNYNMFKK